MDMNTEMGTYVWIFLQVRQSCKNWVLLLCHKLFRTPVHEIKLRNGITFAVNHGKIGPADLSMLTEIWFRQQYNPPFFAIRPDDIVFDVGGNNGFFTIFAATEATSGHVYAFEPVPILAGLIEKNIKSNRLTNVHVENLAMAASASERKFFVSSMHNGCHSLFRRDASDQQIKVKTVDLEGYCQEKHIEKINFLKLDCEGAEYEILLNLSQAMLGKIEKIAMEVHEDVNEHQRGELLAFLNAHGFYTATKKDYLFALNLDWLKLMSDKKDK